MRKQLAVWLGALVCAGALTSQAHAQRRDWGDWVDLGCQRVSFRVDHDALRVGRREGRFKAIRLYARGDDIEMLDLRVIYSNGTPDELPVRRVLRRGDRTPPLDLRGWEREIQRIDMVYRSLPNYRGRDAEVCVEGLAARYEPAPPPAPPPRGAWGPGPRGRDWEELGCQQVALWGRDRDSIRVGRREGRFRALRLRVHGADVDLLDLRVVYANGEPDDIPVRRFLRQGELTPPLDLRGHERAIDRVELMYRTASGRYTATVCVEGLQ